MALTERFRHQHKKILQTVSEFVPLLTEATIDENPQAVAASLDKLSAVVRMHLALEDKSLYPFLAEKGNPEVREMAKLFMIEMGGISTAYLEYAAKWTVKKIKSDPTTFINESQQILKVLGGRIEREETELYAAADKVN